MYKVIECKTSHSNHYKNIGDVPQNIVIISREKEAIKANKYLLSLFSPAIGDLFASSIHQMATIILPDISSSSIKRLLNVISGGFNSMSDTSIKSINTMVNAGKLLCIDI